MQRVIPNYELYGDLLAGRAPDAIHLEQIRERSEKHDWTIRLHRHRRLGQVFLFRSPGVFIKLGDVEHTTTQPTLLVVSPEVEHGFRFLTDVRGEVLSVRLTEMPDRLQSLFSEFQSPTDAIFQQSETAVFEDVAALMDQLGRVYSMMNAHRLELMTTLADLILLYLAGAQKQDSVPMRLQLEQKRGRQDQYAEAFCVLLEESFAQQLAVAEYAALVGVSASHLTRVCRAVLGAPPNDLVRQRRILEAKRLLEYTELSIAEIAYRCGFREAGFFSRSFRSNMGLSPHDYRTGLDRRDAGGSAKV